METTVLLVVAMMTLFMVGLVMMSYMEIKE